MSTPKPSYRDGGTVATDDVPSPAAFEAISPFAGNAPPTFAVFPPSSHPSTDASKTSRSSRRSTILVHQKSPLLLATPPQITRALAYSHPFLLPLNKLIGLLSWTSGDPWESFLLVAAFWALVLYGDVVIRFAGPLVVVVSLVLGMYGRRFSPLSSSGWGEPAREVKDGGSSGNNNVAASGGSSGGSSGGGGGGGVTADARRNQKSANAKNAKTTGNNSSTQAGGHQRSSSASAETTNTRHQKTLDEIVETLKEFTRRCSILLEPLLDLTDFMSTQRTPTSATTRPALLTLFARLLLCTPIWIVLTLPPWRIITTRRVSLVLGTLVLTWHSRVMRVAREILWRSAMVRRLATLTTGLTFEGPLSPTLAHQPPQPPLPPGEAATATDANGALKQSEQAAGTANKNKLSSHRNRLGVSSAGAAMGRDRNAGVKFTFIIFENQRRWVALGWTASLFAYERTAWTDEHFNPVPARDEFELPGVEERSGVRWRWVPGSRWKVDGVPEDVGEGVLEEYDGEQGKNGWIYYDNKWQNGRRGMDGWGRWTRRRKWYRDAELVETDTEDEVPPPPVEIKLSAAEPEATRSVRSLDTHHSSPESRHTVGGDRRPDSAAMASLHGVAERDAAAKAAQSSLAGRDKDREKERERDRDRDKASDDSASVLSTSSTARSYFRAPSLRRRPTDKSVPSVASSSDTVFGSRRRANDAADSPRDPDEADAARGETDDEATGLGLEVELELQGRGGAARQWGVGDEARMGLE